MTAIHLGSGRFGREKEVDLTAGPASKGVIGHAVGRGHAVIGSGEGEACLYRWR